MKDPERQASARRTAPLLSILLALFILRVIGQMLVAMEWNLGFLPEMREWQSGLLPYPVLVISQIAIIGLFGRILRDFTKGQGFWTEPDRKQGMWIMIFGAVYFLSMVVRYILRMHFHPEARWFGGTIPIFLHCILATFVMVVGRFQWKNAH